MDTKIIINAIQQLPLEQKFFVMEEVMKSLKQEELKRQQKKQMAQAAEALYTDYVNEPELTLFTSLDFEDFYETK